MAASEVMSTPVSMRTPRASSSADGVRQAATTVSPRACSWRQYSVPMPRLAPVIR